VLCLTARPAISPISTCAAECALAHSICAALAFAKLDNMHRDASTYLTVTVRRAWTICISTAVRTATEASVDPIRAGATNEDAAAVWTASVCSRFTVTRSNSQRVLCGRRHCDRGRGQTGNGCHKGRLEAHNEAG
jgi:hypothetical protein